MALIDLGMAARQVNVSTEIPENIPVLVEKMAHAEAIVIHYIKRPDHGWTLETDPLVNTDFATVQAAILKVLTNLYAFRGDEQPAVDPLSGVKWSLDMLRKPTVA